MPERIKQLRELCDQAKALTEVAEKLCAELTVRIARTEALLQRRPPTPDRRKSKR